MPPHKRYVETHFGGGAVLFAKNPEGVSEFANDLDKELANFWDVLRNESCFLRFARAVEAMPVSKEAFNTALTGNGFPKWCSVPMIAEAIEFFVRNRQSRQGLGKDFCTPTSRTRRGMNENVSAWLSAIEGLPEVHARLKRVEIRNQDAIELIKELDSPDTLFYCDPPYLAGTRVSKSSYGLYELSEAAHISLLDCLAHIKGRFLLSGYDNPIYEIMRAGRGWYRVDFQIDNKASGAKVKPIKTESLWANYEIQAN